MRSTLPCGVSTPSYATEPTTTRDIETIVAGAMCRTDDSSPCRVDKSGDAQAGKLRKSVGRQEGSIHAHGNHIPCSGAKFVFVACVSRLRSFATHCQRRWW